MPPVRLITNFFNTYRLSTSRGHRVFFIKFSPFLLNILNILRALGYVYTFNYMTRSRILKIYPRFNKRFLQFKLHVRKPLLFSTTKQITHLKLRGYNFILFNPFFDKYEVPGKIITSFDLRFPILSGYLLLSW